MTKNVFRGLMMMAALIAASSPVAFCAANNSNTATVTLTATLPESLTVAATPSAVSFTLVQGGTATGSAPVAITTAWNLNHGRTTVTLTSWFATPAQALTAQNSSTYSPSSEVLGQMTTGLPTTFTAFSATSTTGLGAAGGSLDLFKDTTHQVGIYTRTDNLNLEITLPATPALPADTYSGTLNLQAQAL
jgi:hypothetical protein